MNKKGRIKRIHINQHHIKANGKDDGNRTVMTVKLSGENIQAHSVEINGPSKLVYSPNKPLSCGAKVWVETNAEVTGIDKDGKEYVRQ